MAGEQARQGETGPGSVRCDRPRLGHGSGIASGSGADSDQGGVPGAGEATGASETAKPATPEPSIVVPGLPGLGDLPDLPFTP